MKKFLTILLILISPASFSGDWVKVKNWATPLEVNPVAIEKMLWDYITKNSTQTFQPRDSYTYQYKTVSDHELYINAMCDTHDRADLTQEFVMVFDGGSCYFQATYNFKTNAFVKLEVNGEA